MKVVFLLAADVDIQAAYDALEDLDEGMGDAFLRELDEAAGRIGQFPFSCRLHFDDYRRLVMLKFPYGLFYTVERDRVVVHALMDLRQSPDAIKRRLLGPNDPAHG